MKRGVGFPGRSILGLYYEQFPLSVFTFFINFYMNFHWKTEWALLIWEVSKIGAVDFETLLWTLFPLGAPSFSSLFACVVLLLLYLALFVPKLTSYDPFSAVWTARIASKGAFFAELQALHNCCVKYTAGVRMAAKKRCAENARRAPPPTPPLTLFI